MLRLLRFVFLALAVFAGMGTAAEIPSVLSDQQIATVDAASGLLAIGGDAATRKVYRCTPETRVTLNDKPAKLAELAPGMMAVVTASRPGVASRVAALQVARKEPPMHKVVGERQVTIAATNTGRQALMLGQVFAGQIVKVVARQPVSWTSGGAKSGVYCDWNGYADQKLFGLPRMALVGFVDKAPFLPSGDRFTFVVPKDGMLGFFANDDDAAGNQGAAEITVTIAWF